MKVFMYCPYVRTGGPECLHQYCDMINQMGGDAALYYAHQNSFGKGTISHNSLTDVAPMLYTEYYTNLKRATRVEDDAANILIIPSILKASWARASYKNIRIAVSWLGFGGDGEFNLSDPALIHLFQSWTLKKYVLERAPAPVDFFDLDDYISVDPTVTPGRKSDIVAFNPAKDKTTGDLCKQAGISCVPLSYFNHHDLLSVLGTCKVYVDFGTHIGRDRIPREAALMGCVVITNKVGTAANYEDVAVTTRLDESPLELIKAAFENYETMVASQEGYVQAIRGQKAKFAEQIKAFLLKYGQGTIVDYPPIELKTEIGS